MTSEGRKFLRLTNMNWNWILIIFV